MDSSAITRCGNNLFRWGQRTYIMGIINLSPDSFSGDGFQSLDSARQRALQMVEEGADIIDVGGESTRPDAGPVSADEEIRRVIPFISRIAGSIGVPISVDTYKYEVAVQALNAGACMINDISGSSVDSGIVRLAAEKQVPVVLTGNQRGKKVTDILEAVISQLKDLIGRSIDCGVRPENIIVDPGVGFGKTVEQNLEIVRRLDEIKALGYPVLLGTSRKSFIAATVGSSQEERFMGTAASLAIGITRGADIVRVHDVGQMKLICRMSDAIVGRDTGK
ncbi:MAG: dihydropteroate synthase [Dehalococcoidia bacterium]|jgi:dihydropteroate synthase